MSVLSSWPAPQPCLGLAWSGLGALSFSPVGVSTLYTSMLLRPEGLEWGNKQCPGAAGGWRILPGLLPQRALETLRGLGGGDWGGDGVLTQGFQRPQQQLSGSYPPPAMHRQQSPGKQTGWNSKQREKHLNVSSIFQE